MTPGSHLYVMGDRPDMLAGTHALGGNRAAAAAPPAQAPITRFMFRVPS